ncbi:MAG: cysteine hydrolase [Rhodospirillaceae bacterium]|nr:cysteine hydrolase [Rhodospirillaceae bacterium]
MKIDVACTKEQAYSFDPAKTALLVIDMQRDFCNAEGVGGVGGEDVGPLQKIIPQVEKLLVAARKAGLFIVHTREGHTPDLSTLHDMRRLSSSQAGAPIGDRGPMGRFLVRGEYGHDFVDSLHPKNDEVIVDKPGFDAFYTTELESILRKRGITHTIVCGVTTECCVQSTIRGAVDRGFFSLILSDCCASYYPDMHDATMRVLPEQGNLFGWVGKSTDLIPKLAPKSAFSAAS